MSGLGIVTAMAMFVMALPMLSANGPAPSLHRAFPASDIIVKGKDKWDLYCDTVIQRRKELERQLADLDTLKNADRVFDLEDAKQRIYLLGNVIKAIRQVRKSREAYGISPDAGEIGSTLYIRDSGCIVLSYKGTAGFVHEIMHAAQYERGDIAYWTGKEGAHGLLLDLYEEVEAYKAQYAFERYSIPSKSSGQRIESLAEINAEWVAAITQVKDTIIAGKRVSNILPPYKDHSKIHLDINSPWDSIIRSYPDTTGWTALRNKYSSIKEVEEVKYKGNLGHTKKYTGHKPVHSNT